MIGLATTRAALLRGTTTDALGDEVDEPTVVRGFGSVPVSLIERSRNVQDPSTGTWRTVAYLVARVPANLPVQDGDRLRDLRTGVIYTFDDSTAIPRGIGGLSSRTLEVRQTSA